MPLVLVPVVVICASRRVACAAECRICPLGPCPPSIMQWDEQAFALSVFGGLLDSEEPQASNGTATDVRGGGLPVWTNLDRGGGLPVWTNLDGWINASALDALDAHLDGETTAGAISLSQIVAKTGGACVRMSTRALILRLAFYSRDDARHMFSGMQENLSRIAEFTRVRSSCTIALVGQSISDSRSVVATAGIRITGDQTTRSTAATLLRPRHHRRWMQTRTSRTVSAQKASSACCQHL